MSDVVTVYCTNEQLQRLAALSCDAAVGLQFNTNADSTTVVYGCFIEMDNLSTQQFFEIDADGTYRNVT